MKVSILKPSGDLIARLELAEAGELPERLQELLASGTRVPLRSRVQAGDQCWLITAFNPLQLREETQLPTMRRGEAQRPAMRREDAQRPVMGAAAAPVIETEWRRHSSRRRRGGDGGRNQMMIGLCWCVGGILITILSYTAAASGPGGGTYIVAWGAIVFGGIRFLKGLASSRHR